MSIAYTSMLFFDTPTPRKYSALDTSRLSHSTRMYRPTRSVNTLTMEITSAPIQSVIKQPPSRLLHIESDTGYILECTPDTLLLTPSGFQPLSSLSLSSPILVNGQPSEAYKDKDFLEEHYVRRHRTQQQIADMCSTPDHPVSPRTVRAWIKKYGLNRGDAGAMFGKDNPRYKEDLTTEKGLYARARFNIVKTNVCSICNRKGNTDIHHIDHNLLDSDEDNLIEICEKCHQMQHKGAVIKHTRPAHITVIRPAGFDNSIDLVIDNYVASGFIIKGVTQ